MRHHLGVLNCDMCMEPHMKFCGKGGWRVLVVMEPNYCQLVTTPEHNIMSSHDWVGG